MTIFEARSGNPVRWNGVVSLSALAFLALLGAASADSQHSTELGTNDSAQPSEWGPKKHGLRVSLSARDKELSLGKPILFRLVVENQGSRTVRFAFEQRHVHYSMSIERSDGTNLPCVVPPLSPAVALGGCPWGEVYLWTAIASPEELSTVRKLTATALEIDGR